MGRYSGKAVTVTNDFVSQESNTIDPNSDKNPLLDNSDPSKGSEADREHGDDFQVVGEDLVEEAKNNLQEALELFFETASAEELAQRLHGDVFVTQVEVAVR